MAGKFRAGRGLILGLLVATLGLALVADVSEAGRKERRSRKAPEASTATQEQERPQPQVARTDNDSEAPSPEQVPAITRAQRCLADLGYYKGEIDGKRGRGTRSAFSQFKREHGLESQSDLLAEPVEQKMAELCKTQQDGAPLDAANDPLAPQQEATAEPQTPKEGEASLASPEIGAGETPAGDSTGDDVAYAADAEGAGQEAAGAGPRLDLDCLNE